MTRLLAALSGNALPLAVAAATFTLAVGLPAGDPDMWWHLASGRWMVEHGEGLRVDVFSSTATGEPYALGQWLGEVALYEAYAAAGWTGVAVLRASLVALGAFAVTRLALRNAPARIAIPLAAAAILLSKSTWTDRPQLFTLALFPVVLELCLAARAGSRPALLATVPVVAFWANVHGGYALGIAVLWIFALEAVLERRPALPQLAAALVATVVVSSEPGALSLLHAIGHVAGSTVRIVEESPVDPLTPFGALFALFVGATLLVLMVRGGSLLGALVLVPVLALALSAQRHVPLFGFAAVPFLAGPITALLGQLGTTVKWGRERAGRPEEHLAAGEAGVPAPIESGGSGRPAGPAPWGTHVNGHRIGVDRHRNGVGTHAAGIEGGGEPAAAGPAWNETPTRVDTSDSPPPSSMSYPSRSDRRSRLALPVAGALWLGALASIATAAPGPDLRPYPTRAIDALAASSGILLNEYDWGGYLIWAVPTRPVFVDGRLYPFAGNGVIRSYQEAIHVLPSWRAVIERWNVAQALLRPDRALAQALRDEGWTVRAEGEDFVLLERPR